MDSDQSGSLNKSELMEAFKYLPGLESERSRNVDSLLSRYSSNGESIDFGEFLEVLFVSCNRFF